MDDKKRKQTIRRNFIESLKGIGNSVANSAFNDVAKGVAKSGTQQFLNRYPQSNQAYPQSNQAFPKPAMPLPTSGEFGAPRLPQAENKEKFRWSGQDFTSLRQEERLVFKRSEREIKIQIETVRNELIKLVQETQKISKEVKIAAFQAPVDPGVYHLTFFEKLREFIIFIRKNIAESKNWLAVCNQRSKKRNSYWSKFKKSGTKFMLSAERYMTNQAG
ncbi:DUF5660 family protein [Patescibacteria group bacterium]